MIRPQFVTALALAACLGAPAFAQTTSSNSSGTATHKPLCSAFKSSTAQPNVNCMPDVLKPGTTPTAPGVTSNSNLGVNANTGLANSDVNAGVSTSPGVNTPRSTANPTYTSPSTGVAAGTSGTATAPGQSPSTSPTSSGTKP
jgi:hypothetical protein